MNKINTLEKMYYRRPDIYQKIFGEANKQKAEFIEKLLGKYVSKKKLSLLDVGCGTGDIINSLKSAGRNLVGIDKSTSMVRFARKNHPNIQFLVRDMTKLKFDAEFDVAICMFSTFMYNVSNIEIRSAFRSIERSLKDGGIFVLDLVNFIEMIRNRSYKKVISDSYDVGGFKADMEIKNTLLLKQQAIKSEWKWNIKKVDSKVVNKVIRESTTFRMFFPKELEWMLSDYNFRILEIHSDYKLSSINLDGHRMIIVAKKSKR